MVVSFALDGWLLMAHRVKAGALSKTSRLGVFYLVSLLASFYWFIALVTMATFRSLNNLFSSGLIFRVFPRTETGTEIGFPRLLPYCLLALVKNHSLKQNRLNGCNVSLLSWNFPVHFRNERLSPGPCLCLRPILENKANKLCL